MESILKAQSTSCITARRLQEIIQADRDDLTQLEELEKQLASKDGLI